MNLDSSGLFEIQNMAAFVKIVGLMSTSFQEQQLHGLRSNIGWPVLICILLLMLITVSAPEESKVRLYGTSSILPQSIMSLLKALGRGMSLLIVLYVLYLNSRNFRLWEAAKILLPILAFCAYAIVSTVWSPLKSFTLMQSGSFCLLVLLSWLIAVLWRSEADTSRLLWFASVVLLCISSLLIVLHFLLPQYGVLTREATGLFHSTAGGATASIGLVITLSARLIWGWRWTWFLWMPAIPIHLSCMLIGSNRFSFLAMFVACSLVFLWSAHRALIAALGLGVALCGVAYLCIDPGWRLMDSVTEVSQAAVTQGQSSVQLQDLSGRTEMWATIWQSYLNAPWLGHGFFVTSNSGEIYVWGYWANWTAHNAWLQLLASCGIAGSTLFVSGLLLIVLNLIGPLVSPQAKDRQPVMFVLVLSAWYGTWGMLNESFMGPLQPESVIFSILLGISCAVSLDYALRGRRTLSGSMTVPTAEPHTADRLSLS